MSNKSTSTLKIRRFLMTLIQIPFFLFSMFLFILPGLIYLFGQENLSYSWNDGYLTAFYILILTAGILVASFLITWTLFFIFVELIFRISGKYYIRPISDQEYSELLCRKLIRYTNEITLLENNIVQLEGKISAEKNYVMRFKDKLGRYIWFHQEKEISTNEPDIESFLFSHGPEKRPRKYKVIINPIKLKRKNIYIRPKNKNIIYKGNLDIEAIVIESFNFYNDKVYMNSLISNNFQAAYWHMLMHQTIGRLIDWYIRIRNIMLYKKIRVQR